MFRSMMLLLAVAFAVNVSAQKGYEVPPLKAEYKVMVDRILLQIKNIRAYKTDPNSTILEQYIDSIPVVGKGKKGSNKKYKEELVRGLENAVKDSLAKILLKVTKEDDTKSLLTLGRIFLDTDNYSLSTFFYEKLNGYGKVEDSLFVPIYMYLGDYNMEMAKRTNKSYKLGDYGRDVRRYEREFLKREYKDDTITYPFLLNRFNYVVNEVNKTEGIAKTFYQSILDEVDSTYMPAMKAFVDAGRISDYENTIPVSERIKAIAPADYLNNLYLANMYYADAKYVNSDYYGKVAAAYKDYFATVPKVRDSISDQAINNYRSALQELKDYQTLADFAASITPLCRPNEIFPYSFRLEAASKNLTEAKATYVKEKKTYEKDSIGLAKEGMLQYLEKSPNFLKAISACEKAEKDAREALVYVEQKKFPISQYALSDYLNAYSVQQELEDYSGAINTLLTLIEVDSLRWYKKGYEIVGNLYNLNKQCDEAVAAYRIVMGVDSATSERMYARIANAYAEAKRSDEAVNTWLDFYNRNPKEIETFVSISNIYRREKKYDEAIDNYAKYIELCADSVQPGQIFNFAELCREAYEKTQDVDLKKKYKEKASSLYTKTLHYDDFSNRFLSLFILGIFNLGEGNAPTLVSTDYFVRALECWPEGKGASNKFNAALLTTQFYCMEIISASETDDKNKIKAMYPLARKYSDITVALNENNKNTQTFKNYLDDMKRKYRLR